MNIQKNIRLLILILTGVAVAATWLWVWGFYRTFLDEERAGLSRMVRSQARLIEAVAQFDREHSTQDHPAGAWGATLEQLGAAQNAYSHFGETGEIVFSRIEEGRIVFLFKRRFAPEITSLPLDSPLAVATRRALLGHSGTMVGLDYRGATVLAAYEYIDGINVGLVAKIDLAELRRPFIKAGILGGIGTVLIVLVGAFYTRRVMRPVVAELETSIGTLSEAQQIAHVGNWVWNIKTGGLEWSDETYHIFGFEKRAFKATYEAFLERVHPDDRAKVEEAVTLAVAGLKNYSIEHRIVLRNGEERYVAEIGRVTFDAKGTPIRMNGTIQDISERKQIEDDLRDLTIRLEEANQAKSEFMATMSHEFRTPLNAILGFSEMLRLQYFGPLGSKNYQEYADDIYVSGQHLLVLINDMLDIAAIEAGKRTLSKENIDLCQTLEDCIRNVAPLAMDKGLTLDLAPCERTLFLHADKRSLVQIVLNLLSNAIKFTEKGGTVSVRAAAEKDGIAVKVSDTGVGIPADKLPTITDPFSQAHSDPYLSRTGTGLGLSIVKSLVDAHGGMLRIESELGVGTTVTVTFPQRDTNAAHVPLRGL